SMSLDDNMSFVPRSSGVDWLMSVSYWASSGVGASVRSKLGVPSSVQTEVRRLNPIYDKLFPTAQEPTTKATRRASKSHNHAFIQVYSYDSSIDPSLKKTSGDSLECGDHPSGGIASVMVRLGDGLGLRPQPLQHKGSQQAEQSPQPSPQLRVFDVASVLGNIRRLRFYHASSAEPLTAKLCPKDYGAHRETELIVT
ncbi:12720_t:CDS:2, partial [Acaulospora colombiana]